MDAIATHQTQTNLLSVLTVEYFWWWEVMPVDNTTVCHSQLWCYSKQTPRSPGASASSFPVPFSTSTCLPLNHISLSVRVSPSLPSARTVGSHRSTGAQQTNSHTTTCGSGEGAGTKYVEVISSTGRGPPTLTRPD